MPPPPDSTSDSPSTVTSNLSPAPRRACRNLALRAFRSGRARWPRLVQFVLTDLLPNSLPHWLPSACALCGNLPRRSPGVRSAGARPRGARPILCAACDGAYWNEARLRCTVCALPLSSRRSGHGGLARYRCDACVKTPPAFDATIALADYRAPLDALARGLKFRARLGLGEEFARRLARAAEDALDPADPPALIVPVPLSRERLIERGYNQAWQIAKPLARALGARADATLVRRTLDTAAQSKLDRDTRRRNVGRAFALRPARAPLDGLHIGVVDDVMTSGATLDAMAQRLKAAGARRVTNFVALRTPKD